MAPAHHGPDAIMAPMSSWPHPIIPSPVMVPAHHGADAIMVPAHHGPDAIMAPPHHTLSCHGAGPSWRRRHHGAGPPWPRRHHGPAPSYPLLSWRWPTMAPAHCSRWCLAFVGWSTARRSDGMVVLCKALMLANPIPLGRSLVAVGSLLWPRSLGRRGIRSRNERFRATYRRVRTKSGRS